MELEQTFLKFVRNHRRLRTARATLKQKQKQKQSWRHHNSRLQVILQSCSNQNSMVLAQKQTHGSMEPYRKSRNKPTTMWSINLHQSRKEYPVGKRWSLQQMMLGKLNSNMQKHETGPLSYTIHKNKNSK